MGDMMENNLDEDTKRYTKMLQSGTDGDANSDDDDDSDSDALEKAEESDDGFNSAPLTPEEHQSALTVKKNEKNPLIVELPDEPTSVKAARWFSNPLFSNIAEVAKSVSNSQSKKIADNTAQEYDSDSDDNIDYVATISSDEEDADPASKKSKQGLNVEDILSSIPKTDKQVRHERRLKSLARLERKKKRLAKIAGDDEEFQVVAAEYDQGKKKR